MVICPMHPCLEINSSGEDLGYFCSPSCSSCAVCLMPGYPGFGDISRVTIIALSDVFVSLKGHQAQLDNLGGCCELSNAFPRACRHQEYGFFLCLVSRAYKDAASSSSFPLFTCHSSSFRCFFVFSFMFSL